MHNQVSFLINAGVRRRIGMRVRVRWRRPLFDVRQRERIHLVLEDVYVDSSEHENEPRKKKHLQSSVQSSIAGDAHAIFACLGRGSGAIGRSGQDERVSMYFRQYLCEDANQKAWGSCFRRVGGATRLIFEWLEVVGP